MDQPAPIPAGADQSALRELATARDRAVAALAEAQDAEAQARRARRRAKARRDHYERLLTRTLYPQLPLTFEPAEEE